MTRHSPGNMTRNMSSSSQLHKRSTTPRVFTFCSRSTREQVFGGGCLSFCSNLVVVDEQLSLKYKLYIGLFGKLTTHIHGHEYRGVPGGKCPRSKPGTAVGHLD
jgi:hypothetical protein